MEIKGTVEQVEETISKPENKPKETVKSEKQKKRLNESEQNLRDQWHRSKEINMHIVGVPEGDEEKKGKEKVSQEIMAEKHQI